MLGEHATIEDTKKNITDPLRIISKKLKISPFIFLIGF